MKALGIIIAVLVVGGGAWYFVNNKGGSLETAGTQGSFADVLARGGNYECTFTSTDPDSESSGVIYVSDKRIRGDFKSMVEKSGLVASSMIVDGKAVYTWSDATPLGIKIPIVSSEDGSNQVTDSFNSENKNASVDYECKSWKVDETMFVPPSGIQFMGFPTTSQ